MLIITGTGRCGTSLVAQFFNEVGYSPGGRFDPTVSAGFEIPAISQYHDKIWDLYHKHGNATLAQHAPWIKGQIREVFKDPRFVSMPGGLEAWIAARNDLRFILMYRPFVHSVQSANRCWKTKSDIGDQILGAKANFDRFVTTCAYAGVPVRVVKFPECISDYSVIHAAVTEFARLPLDYAVGQNAWSKLARPDLVRFRDGHTPPTGHYGADLSPLDPSFAKIGQEYLGFLRSIVGLNPSKDVLEIGSGFGRIARALAAAGACRTYLGLDCLPEGVAYCNKVITSVNPRFKFRRLDVANRYYNPTGSVEADKVVLEIPDKSMDIVYLTSVFTHMLPAAIRNYLSEIKRVLKDDGKLFCTWFLAEDDAKDAIGRAVSMTRVNASMWTANTNMPECAVAYKKSLVLRWFAAAGFKDVQVADGHWQGGQSPHGQDHIWATI